MAQYQIDSNRVTTLDLGGFNELRFCRHGPMLYNKNDQYVGRSLQRYGEFSHGEWQLFEKIVTLDSTVIEVGANIGAHTVPLAQHSKRVIAFEPQRYCFQLLNANIALNQLTNVEAYQCAVSQSDFGTNRIITMPVYDPTQPCNFGGVSAGGMNVPAGVPLEVVDCVGLDTLKPTRCSFLKLDVEGWETDVLRGASYLIETERPIMYVENDRREKSEELVTLIRSMGYDLYWHLPPLFNPLNHANVRENLFPYVVSINMLCMPNGVKPPMDLQPVKAYNDLWT